VSPEQDSRLINIVISKLDNLRRVFFVERGLLDFDNTVMQNINAHPQQPLVAFAFLHTADIDLRANPIAPIPQPPAGILFGSAAVGEMLSRRDTEPWIEAGLAVHSLSVEWNSDWPKWHRA